MNSFSLILLLGLLCAVEPLTAPIKAIYIDYQGINYNAPADAVKMASDAGFNIIILAFFLSASGPTDMALAFTQDPNYQAAITYVHSAGGVVLVSVGGGTDSPYSIDPTTLANNAANYVKKWGLDGMDFDLENLGVGFEAPGLSGDETVTWIATLTNAARAAIPNAIITHAPQAPYFGPIGDGATWVGGNGGYSGVYAKAPSIDYFLVQFYNQGATCYVDYNGIFVTSCSNFPLTSVTQIASTGVPLSKIILGKIVTSANGGSGFLPASTINSVIAQASSSVGWNSGVMGWVWNDPATCQSWISTIYPSGTPATPVPAPAPAPASPSPSPASPAPAPAPSTSGTCYVNPALATNLPGPIQTTGACGSNAPGSRCFDGQCCSQYGYCGSSSQYCNANSQGNWVTKPCTAGSSTCYQGTSNLNLNGPVSGVGLCGNNMPGSRCADNQCCSQYGYCGTASAGYCTNNQGDWIIVPCAAGLDQITPYNVIWNGTQPSPPLNFSSAPQLMTKFAFLLVLVFFLL